MESNAVDSGPPTQPSLDAVPDPFELPWVTGVHNAVTPPPGQASAAPTLTSQPPVTEAPVADYPSDPLTWAVGPDLKHAAEPQAVTALPIEVLGQGHFLKRWTFLLVLLAVWVPTAAIGVGLYYLWFTSIDKTMPVFLVLVFLTVCTVAGMQLAAVENKPLVAAVAIALLSAPLAATSAAAVLHGAYYFQWIARPG